MIVPDRLAAVLVLAGLPALYVRPQVTTVLAWVTLVAVLVVLDGLAAPDPTFLEWERRVDSPVRPGSSLVSTVSVRGAGRRGARLRVRDAWPPSLDPTPRHHDLALARGEAREVATTLTPHRRGRRPAGPLTVRSRGPLHLAWRQRTLDAPLDVEVLPEFRARRLLPGRLALLEAEMGRTTTRLRGAGTDFDTLRTWVEGDDPRDVDWRATARSDELVVRTWRPERDTDLVLVLDTGRAGAALLGGADGTEGADSVDLGAAPRLDAGIEAALLTGLLADHAGDRVHLIALDQKVRARVSARSGPLLVHEWSRALADVHAEAVPLDWELLHAEVTRVSRPRSLVIVLTEVPPPGADPDSLTVLARLARSRRVVVASARDPELARLARGRADTAAVHVAAAATSSIAEVEAGVRSLQRSGCVVVDVDSDLLPARVADTYVREKTRGDSPR